MITISGVEGPDILFHLQLLGQQFKQVHCGIFHFVPLVDHYNTHSANYFAEQELQANKSKYAVLYDLVNIGDNELGIYTKQVEDFDHPNKIYLTVNQSKNLKVNCELVQWDFMWNRFLAYYFETITVDQLHQHTPGAYSIPNIDYTKLRSRDFLSLYRRRDQQRDRLYDQVKNYNGYCSNFPAGIALDDLTAPGFAPVSHDFYQDSYFSIFVESNYSNPDLIHITEKTYEPLIKGHLILPVTNPSSIDYLKARGFKFSNINYSFDNIDNYEERFNLIIEEFHRIKAYARDIYMSCLDDIKHNLEVFKLKQYDRRILQIFNR
jgi:hypothetical protein